MRHSDIVLNGTHFQMPAITLGSGWFGTKVSRETAFSLMDYYTAQGGTWLDSARVYGPSILKPGERLPHFVDSEGIIGEWLRNRKMRNRVTIISKGAHYSMDTGEKRISAENIRMDAEKSLRTLGVDCIDLYFLHNDDERVPVSEIMPVLHTLYTSGKVRAIGASNWNVQRIQEANTFAMENNLTPFSVSQVRWSYVVPINIPLEGNYNLETDPVQYTWYLEQQMPIMAFSSQARGFFIKTARLGFDPQAIGRAAAFLSDGNCRRSEALKQLAEEEHINIPAMTFAYLWGKETPVTALVGCQTLDDLKDTMRDHNYLPPHHVTEALEAARDDGGAAI